MKGDISGKRFGRLVVCWPSGISGQDRVWLCLCDCGNLRNVNRSNLGSGKTRGCGCVSRKHGHFAHRSESRTHRSWKSMVERCYSQKSISWPRYGARGIRVCRRWRGKTGFLNFLADMGDRPIAKTLGRIDNSKGYSPRNCRWEDSKQQQNNKSNTRMITFNGVTKSATLWADHLGIPRNAIYKRLSQSWPVSRVLGLPVQKRNRV